MKRLILIAFALTVAACGGDGGPTAPTPPSTPTRIIDVSGGLNFGETELGTTKELSIVVRNTGNSALSVTGVTGNNASALTVVGATFTLQPNTQQTIPLRFTPTELRDYTGSVTVTSNKTSGNDTIPYAGRGITTAPIFTRSGNGNTVFDMPTYIRRVRIQGTWNRTGNSNFIVSIGGRLVLNEILRDSITYDGISLVIGGVTEIESSSNIAWIFTEVR